MKRLLLIPVLFLGFFGCDNRPSDSQLMFQGDHALRKMSSIQGVVAHGELNGFFVFGTGSITGTEDAHSELLVTFAWKGNSGDYLVSTLPVSKFRFSFDEFASTPHVKFRWRPCYGNCDADKDSLIEYVVLVCREKDWPKDIKLPLNK